MTRSYIEYVGTIPGALSPLGMAAVRTTHVKLRGVGDAASGGDPGTSMTTADSAGNALPATTSPPQLQQISAGGDSHIPWMWILSSASSAASAFHGYRRNNSVGWAVVWGILGAVFPVITPAIAVAQGFGKRAGR